MTTSYSRAHTDSSIRLEESTAASRSPITTVGVKKETRGDAAPEEQRYQAMRAVLLIPLVVVFLLIVLNLVTRRYDEDGRGHGQTMH
jgi:hypothetical protein